MDLPTMGVGSYAAPGWLFLFREAMRAGRTGAEDVEEAFDDATRIAIADQIEAGVDIVSDGELRRSRFVYEMYDRLTGIERLPPGRRLGVPGYDRAPHFVARERVSAPDGLGIAAEYRRLVELAPGKRLKVAFPGPMTFMPKIEPDGPYGGDTMALLDDIAGIVRDELDRLAGRRGRIDPDRRTGLHRPLPRSGQPRLRRSGQRCHCRPQGPRCRAYLLRQQRLPALTRRAAWRACCRAWPCSIAPCWCWSSPTAR